jgi:DNA-binding NtrC family response regulator
MITNSVFQLKFSAYSHEETMEKPAIICVDDESMVLWMLRDQINANFGDRCRCEIAETVDEAWEVIEELNDEGVKILGVISDWLMPGVKGDEFLIELHQRFPDILTIMLTGQADKEAVERVRQYGNLYAYIRKPWAQTALIMTLKAGLEKNYPENS